MCSICGTSNPAGARFCEECGSRLASSCAACGAALGATAKFCAECGTPAGPRARETAVSTAADRPVAPVPVAERRLVSVLFADLVGFTSLAEGRDAEDTRELLTRYFDLASDVIGRYGGAVEKFIGDAVMAVWGSPIAHEDDAERAVRAALELVDTVRTIEPGLAARAGVLTGEAAVTLDAINQGMVAGDLVNTASRLQSAAPPGAVLVGEATQRAASLAIVFEPAGDQTLKGKAAPVPAWRAMRVVAERGGRNRAETLEAPFVGRDAELRLVKDLYHATVREQRARLVSVVGPAGIGKSRLAWEFAKYCDGLAGSVWFHDGRSPAYGKGISFWALGEMVRSRAGLSESDDEATTRARIAETIAVHIHDDVERRWIEPALLALLGVESRIASEQLFAAWRTYFERMAESAPVVLVFEDFHYADSGLIDFVDHLLEWSKTVAIYVVTLSRRELLERRANWGAGKPSFTSIVLEALPAAAMRELLAGLVPGLPEPTLRAIAARADGVPLYAVETVRMLLAEKKVVLEAGIYRPTGDLSTLAVPQTLIALIAARLDALGSSDRSLVSDAAVLGQSFTVAALAAVSRLAETDLEPALRRLVRREILTLETDPNSPERGQYAFVQALIREVAYQTLARRDRKSRHLAAARFFESLGSDQLAGALAAQYLAAHENAAAGAEADALAAEARVALRAAAQRATLLNSHAQALGLLSQALTVTSEPAEEAELLEMAGESASASGHHDDAEALLRRAVARHRELGDRSAVARASAALGRALLVVLRAEPALAVLEPAAEEFADLRDDAGFVAVLSQLSRAYLLLNQPPRAIAIADRLLPDAERIDLVAIVADTLVTRGLALGYLGQRYQGLGVVEIGLRLAEQHGLNATVLRARTNVGVLLAVEDPHAALRNDLAGLTEARRLGLRRWALVLLMNATEAGVVTGDWAWAIPELEELVGSDLEREDRIVVLHALILLRCWRGESVDGLIAEIETLAGNTSSVQSRYSAAVARAVRGFALGDLEGAAGTYRQAAALFADEALSCYGLAARASILDRDADSAASDLVALEATGNPGPVIGARCVSIRAGLAALAGRPAEALLEYEDALRRFRDLRLPVDEAFTAIEMATLLDLEEPVVRSAVEAARDILVGLEAAPFIARLDAASPGHRTKPVRQDGDAGEV